MLLVVETRAIRRQTDAVHKTVVAKAAKAGQPSIKEAPKKHFPAGVMAGDAEPDGGGQGRVVLWTRYTGKKKQLLVRIRQTPPKGSDLRPDKPVKVKDGGFVHYDAENLKPGTQYKYMFLEKAADGELLRSPVGRFWTPIAPDALVPVKFGGTSCTMQTDKRRLLTNKNLQHASHEDLRFFVHLGDQLYCDAPKTKPALSLKGFRKKYSRAFSMIGLKSLHEAFGMYTTWDDHEVFNGWQGDRDTLGKRKVNHVVADQGKKKIKKIMRWGVQSFYDHQPIRRENRTPKKKRLWRSFRWGRTLEIFVVDCRTERFLKRHRYISKAQEEWLIQGVQSSNAVFKFILNSRPIGYFLNKPKKKPENAKAPDEDYRWTHPWVQKQRDRILKKMGTTAGVWWLSGDVHFGTTGWVNLGAPKDGEKRIGEVLMGPGGQWVGEPGTEKWKEKRCCFLPKLIKKKHIEFATLESNYVVINAKPAQNIEESTLDIEFYGGNKGKSRRLHQETRSYAGEVMGASPAKKLRACTCPKKKKKKKKKKAG